MGVDSAGFAEFPTCLSPFACQTGRAIRLVCLGFSAKTTYALLALIEPLLLLGVAGTVLVILVALYLPIFSMGTLVR